MSACVTCGGSGLVAATPGIGADGPAPCPVCSFHRVLWRVVPNELRPGSSFVCWYRGEIDGTSARAPWDEDSARVRYISNHSVFFFDLPHVLAEKLAADWNSAENWRGES